MAFVTPNDSILRSSNLETSLRTVNIAQKNVTGKAPLPIAQQKTFAPSFVNRSNEFDFEHIGRFYYLFQLFGIKRITIFALLITLLANIAVGVALIFDDFCIDEPFFNKQVFYCFGFLLPLIAHYNGLQGVRKRKTYQLIVYLVYTTLEVLGAIGVNIINVQHTFTGSKCSMHIVLAASLLGVLAYFQIFTSYFVYEYICYVHQYVHNGKSKKQREATTKLNTLLNSRIASEQSETEETTVGLVTPNAYSVEPNEEIQDTLQQVIKTWEYQRNRRRKSKTSSAVKFDEQNLLLKSGPAGHLTKSQSKL